MINSTKLGNNILQKEKNIKIGIGFAAGRKNFQRLLRTYIYSWEESGLVENEMVSLNLFIAYDLTYHKTQVTDYTDMYADLVEKIDSRKFIGSNSIKEEIDFLVQENIISHLEASIIFDRGYASNRNIILYNAVKNNMDYLIYLDDDEYPLAVTNTKNTAVWGGQHVLAVHLKYINHSDITHGYHCGYISPIPHIDFNDIMTETDFRTFIEAINNDIITWENIVSVMNDGGVTYADTSILTNKNAFEVKEKNHAKFISGANLCINLKDPCRIFPFYNPPGARGEDTFLSTCLSERTIIQVPCYTFHDGFMTYKHLLSGVLPTRLKYVKADSEKIITRFYKACIGWIRYKPLLLYITHPDSYIDKIDEMREKLKKTLPQICTYFQEPDFINVLSELEKYHKNVEKHYNAFMKTQDAWAKIMKYFSDNR